jgi:glycosyltransferase involved in cell wall biosynthesis
MIDNKLSKPLVITEHNWEIDIVPTISVFNWTYNHKEFIRESIDSILMQKTTFKVEIIIHDDASNDGTAEIIREYEKQFPKLFFNVLHEENQYSQGKNVMLSLFEKPRGKYVALAHGDDYWTDPNKLQKQVDFLEANEEYVLCFHAAKILNVDGSLNEDNILIVPIHHETLLDLAKRTNYIRTLSVVYKNITQDYPTEFYDLPLGDYPLYVYLSQFGKIKYFEEQMAVYRFDVGFWSNKDSYFKYLNTVICYAMLYEYFYNNEKLDIANIFADKIFNFLIRTSEIITDNDINRILNSENLRRYIVKHMSSELLSITPHLLKNTSTKKLIKEIIRRIKFRFTK